MEIENNEIPPPKGGALAGHPRHFTWRGSSPTPVGVILATAFPGLRERLLEARIRKEWEHLMGQEIARRARPLALSQGVLQVTVTNSPWLQELTLREPDLRGRLTDRYGGDAVRALRFSLGALPGEAGAEDLYRGHA